MSSTVSTDGLRARKRRETRARLEESALSLVHRDGLEHVTIEQICERADVSARTFFNYFDSKEDALLGTQAIQLDVHALTELRDRYQGAEPVEAVVGLIFILCGPSIDHMVDQKQRVEVILRHPDLAAKVVSRLAQLSASVTSAVRNILDGGKAGTSTVDGMAEAVLGLCESSMRCVVMSSLSRAEPLDLSQLERRTLELAKGTVRRLGATLDHADT